MGLISETVSPTYDPPDNPSGRAGCKVDWEAAKEAARRKPWECGERVLRSMKWADCGPNVHNLSTPLSLPERLTAKGSLACPRDVCAPDTTPGAIDPGYGHWHSRSPEAGRGPDHRDGLPKPAAIGASRARSRSPQGCKVGIPIGLRIGSSVSGWEVLDRPRSKPGGRAATGLARKAHMPALRW
jgi:hypothetical protein